MQIEKLDNPVWNSLNEIHQDFAVDYEGVNFYKPDYCPFGGFINTEKTEIAIDEYAKLANNFYVVGDKPNFNNKVQLNKELVCNQMLIDKPINIEITEYIIELQTTNHKADLFALVNLVQPGYFKDNTADLGNYYGIYKENKLVAVTGERMKMNDYTELSAVVTHPEHTGKGYAKQLLAYASSKIFNENKTPFLHVADTNIGAIKLYEKLGFKTRKKISFWNFITNNIQ